MNLKRIGNNFDTLLNLYHHEPFFYCLEEYLYLIRKFEIGFLVLMDGQGSGSVLAEVTIFHLAPEIMKFDLMLGQKDVNNLKTNKSSQIRK